MSIVAKNVFAILRDDENEEPIINTIAKQETKKVTKPAAPKPKIAEKASQKPIASAPTKVYVGTLGTTKDNRAHPANDKKRRVPAHGRVFDRKSGTGRRDDGDKKEVAGKASWGNPTTAEEEGEKVKAELETEDAVVEEVQEPEQEENFKTLGQFLAEKQTATAVKLAELTIRKPNEGSDDSKWKNAVVLTSKKEEDLFAGKSKTMKAKPVKEKAQKTILEIEQKFTEPAFKPRDNRPAANSRGKEKKFSGPKKTFINVADSNAFPSLGSK